jgi:hypothetical protein
MLSPSLLPLLSFLRLDDDLDFLIGESSKLATSFFIFISLSDLFSFDLFVFTEFAVKNDLFSNKSQSSIKILL